MKCYYPAHPVQAAASYNEAVQADYCLCSSTAQVWYLQLVISGNYWQQLSLHRFAVRLLE